MPWLDSRARRPSFTASSSEGMSPTRPRFTAKRMTTSWKEAAKGSPSGRRYSAEASPIWVTRPTETPR
jgi:hypothetical protein